jgi:hypothetical protein
MNRPPEAPFNKLETLLKGMDFFLAEFARDMTPAQQQHISEARQKIAEVLKPIEEKKKTAHEAVYGSGTWQPKPLGKQEKLAFVKYLQNHLSNIDTV